MYHLTKLFRLLEITRAQPQYGFALAEIPKSDLSDLAQHHYLVTFFAWQLARLVKRAGGEIDGEKVLEIALIHDLGELFGGDIGMPYAKANPTANKLAKAFEAENLRYFSTLMGEDEKYFSALTKEALQPTSLEGVVAKIADYMEVTHYKLYMHRLSSRDVGMVTKRFVEFLKNVPDKKIRKVLSDFITQWEKDLADGKLDELFEHAK